MTRAQCVSTWTRGGPKCRRQRDHSGDHQSSWAGMAMRWRDHTPPEDDVVKAKKRQRRKDG